ncbi:MAG: tyrosine-type recombinase/integrase [Variovorax sp.]|nr:tyrosine-type recombinase/integrase [Variovorax sp.]
MEAKKALGTLSPAKAGGVTNGELFEAYLDAVASKTDSEKWNRLRLMKWCNDPLADKRVVDTITHDINEWIERSLSQESKRTKKPVTPATVNRELNLMSGAFNYAVKVRQWITVNPCHGAMRPERGKARKRPLLTPAELQALRISTGYDSDPLLRTLTSRVGACFLLSLETGLRSGELLRVRPMDYRKEQRLVHVAAIEKGGRKASRSGRASVDPSRNVPLSARAIELLDQLLATMPADQPYIVGLNDSQRDALWRKARDQAGVEDLHFHDTKHEAATRLSRFIDVLALSHAIGTKDIRLLRDTYYNEDATRAAALLPSQLSPALPPVV